MDLQIRKVIDFGTLASERVIIDVINDCQLHYYLLADTTYTAENTISNEWKHTKWFATRSVKKGDEVIVYTRTGNNEKQDLGNGRTRHVIFWNLGNSVWNNKGDAAILLQIKTWKTTKVN